MICSLHISKSSKTGLLPSLLGKILWSFFISFFPPRVQLLVNIGLMPRFLDILLLMTSKPTSKHMFGQAWNEMVCSVWGSRRLPFHSHMLVITFSWRESSPLGPMSRTTCWPYCPLPPNTLEHTSAQPQMSREPRQPTPCSKSEVPLRALCRTCSTISVTLDSFSSVQLC